MTLSGLLTRSTLCSKVQVNILSCKKVVLLRMHRIWLHQQYWTNQSPIRSGWTVRINELQASWILMRIEMPSSKLSETVSRTVAGGPFSTWIEHLLNMTAWTFYIKKTKRPRKYNFVLGQNVGKKRMQIRKMKNEKNSPAAALFVWQKRNLRKTANCNAKMTN